MERRFEAPIIVATLRMVPVLLRHGGVLSAGSLQLFEYPERVLAAVGRRERLSCAARPQTRGLCRSPNAVVSRLVQRDR
jgi:hypothetical protein